MCTKCLYVCVVFHFDHNLFREINKEIASGLAQKRQSHHCLVLVIEFVYSLICFVQ